MRLLDDLELDNVAIAGHSLGAAIALELAGLQPARVDRIVLVSGTLFSAADLLRRPTDALSRPRQAAALAAQFVGGMLPLGNAGASALLASGTVGRLALRPFMYDATSVDQVSLRHLLAQRRRVSSVARVMRIARGADLTGTAALTRCEVSLVWGAEDRLIMDSDIDRARRLMNVVDAVCIPRCGHWPHVERPDIVAATITRGSSR